MAFLATLGPWLLKNWKLALGGLVIAGLGIALLIARSDATHWHKKADGLQSALTLEVDKHKITLASVATLERALAGKNAESEARAKAFEQAKLDSASQVAALNARWAAGESARGGLQAILHNPPSGVCKVPDGLLAGLEGL